MPVVAKRLKVLPNPWSCIDHLGRPCGVVPCDPVEHVQAQRRWVGAKPKAVQTAPRVAHMVKTTLVVVQEAQHDLTWSYSTEPVEVPNTPYYRERVKQGDLIAADLATANACNLKRFTNPALHERNLKELSIRHFDSRNGEGTFEALGEERKIRADAALEAAKKARRKAGEAEEKAAPPAPPQPEPAPAEEWS